MKAVLFGMANTAFTLAPFQVESAEASAEASAEDVQLLPPRDGAHGNLSIPQRTPFLTLEIRSVSITSPGRSMTAICTARANV